VPETVIKVVEVIVPWASCLAALAAFLAALAAWRSARQAKKALNGQMLHHVMDAYSSPEMLEGIHRLLALREEYPTDFANRFAQNRKIEPRFQQLDKDRRRLAHWFHKIRMLAETSVLSESFIKKLVTPDQVGLLLVLDEPLEVAINPNYDKTTFDFFRRLFPDATHA
jgi:hypothetical protein